MRQLFLILIVAGFILPYAAEVHAETQYISDRLLVSLRNAPSDQYKALDTLESDTPVEVLGEKGRFLQVRTKKGTVGYIPAQYLTAQTPSPFIIKRLQAQIADYKKQVATLKAQLREGKGDLAAMLQGEQAKVQQLQQELTETKEKLAVAERDLASTLQSYEQLQQDAQNVVEITQERNRLDAKVNELLRNIEALEQENNTLVRTGVIKWFVAGGGVFFVGWLSGKISRKKKRGFS